MLGEAREDPRGAHATANTHSDHAVAGIAAFQFANDAGGKFGPGAAERMIQCGRSTVGVYFRWLEAGLLDDGVRLSGKRLIQLEYGNVFLLQTRKLTRSWNCVVRANTEFLVQ